jgi:hypothetical protein
VRQSLGLTNRTEGIESFIFLAESLEIRRFKRPVVHICRAERESPNPVQSKGFTQSVNRAFTRNKCLNSTMEVEILKLDSCFFHFRIFF